MPFYRKPKNFTPLLIAAENKAVKSGLHHSIFTSRFDRYVGDWKNDLKEGKGLFMTISGKLYEGDWYDGFRHGTGTLSRRLDNGTFYLEYRGEWVRGKPEGCGWRYYDNGDVYFGYWKRGERHGYGKMWYANGTFYVGYWNMSLREGLGMFVQASPEIYKTWGCMLTSYSKSVYAISTYILAQKNISGLKQNANKENGNRYEGHWENNVKSGIGRFYHMHTGQLQEGCWIDNICVKSKVSDIILRQCCDHPTQYPIPPEQLRDSRILLEDSELWLKQKIGNTDKQLQYCIDQMD